MTAAFSAKVDFSVPCVVESEHMNHVPVPREPDCIHHKRERDCKGVSDQDAQEEGLPSAVEHCPADLQEDAFNRPDQKGREGQLPREIRAGDGQTDGAARLVPTVGSD